MGCTEIRVDNRAHISDWRQPPQRMGESVRREEGRAYMPESHHETGSAVGPISGEAARGGCAHLPRTGERFDSPTR